MKLYRTKDLPTKMSVSCDYLLRARAASIGDHVVHVFNLQNDKLSFARGTPIHLFNAEAIKDAGLYADRHDLGGAGFYCGKEDVVCNFHINREVLEDPEKPALQIFRERADMVCRVLNKLGVSVSVKTDRGRNIRDGVCINLEGRSEIVTEDGTKLAGGVYRDDGLIFTAYEIILVSDAWTKIYDYMKDAPPKAKATSLQHLVPGVTTDNVINLLCEQMGDYEEADFTFMDFKSMERLSPRFGYDRWQA